MTRKSLLLVSAVLALFAVSAPVWKPVAKQWKWFLVATNMYQDLLRRSHLRTDQIGQGTADARPTSEVPDVLSHAESTFRTYLDYLTAAGLDVRGLRVLEAGPGDNLGIALQFVAAGARQVVAIDKFVPLQTSRFHRALYTAARDRLNDEERQRFDTAIDLSDGVKVTSGPLSYVYGRGIEEVDALFPPATFDLIVSNAVLEEVYDIDRTLAAFDTVWRPGGLQIHKIDLRDYGMFTKHGFHPLEFLTVPDTVYRLMVESTGQPNRRLVDYYRGQAASRGYEATIYTTYVLGHPHELKPPPSRLHYGTDYTEETLAKLREIRPRLLDRYRRLPDEDLIVQGIVFVARQAAARSQAAARQ